jgi:hypothetical protein
MNSHPQFALSIRQPWAWLILNAGKLIENRTWPTYIRGRVFIHAGKTMTKREYCETLDFAAPMLVERRIQLPDFDALERGGILGSVEIVTVIEGETLSDRHYVNPDELRNGVGSEALDWIRSPWYAGPFGFCLRDPLAVPFRPCNGALGFFKPVFKEAA